jgi:hypothetical protein
MAEFKVGDIVVARNGTRPARVTSLSITICLVQKFLAQCLWLRESFLLSVVSFTHL